MKRDYALPLVTLLLAIGMTYYDSISRRAATRRRSPTIASGARTA